ncbi:MAG: VOC family protein [Nitrososphaerales archaeon]
MPRRSKKVSTTRKAKSRRNQGRRQSASIPKGFGTVTPYLVVTNGAQAIEFYKKAFDAKELSRNSLPDGKILNAQLKLGGSIVMLADEFPGSSTKSPSSLGVSTVTLHVYTEDVDKLWEQVLAAGARIVMPLDNQFWGERYGQLTDPFGHHWSLSQRVKMNPEEMEEKQKAAMAMFAQGEQPGGNNPENESPPIGVG